ncbi:amidase [Rhizodiscina lignyota]|uniref:Amidase n=1 Tax=Rhizodiscina lignyota TaxID=1504668 RepID=A0A9P4M5Q7_9PEZI|nr:amidase [Rhizodiscina lignyota]
MHSTKPDYQIIAAEKKLQQANKIPKDWLISAETHRNSTNVLDVPVTCGILDNVECEITSEYDATALLEKLRSGLWSAEQVTIAFCKRAAIAQQLTNCLTEIFFDEAIERARQLDKERQQNPSGNALRPLHGLPISLKDSFQVAGYDTSTGLACYVNEPAEENSSTAAMLLDLGAVLYCKTNLPQSIMTGDSDNNVFGRTFNPRNELLTAGGSTGGEGALIALRGSVLGVGTDICGSIRIPSLCNGIYGFRPSVGLVPHGGVRDLNVPGTDGIRSTAGPMATSIRDCRLFVKTLMQTGTWRYDSTVVSLPWTNVKAKERLRIAVVENDGIYTPTPPIRRAMKEAATLLEKSKRIEIIPLTLPDVKEHYQNLVSHWAVSGGDHYLEQFARTGEPLVPSLKALGLLDMRGTTLKGFFDLNVRQAEAAKEYLRLFRDNNLDAILMPPAPHTAIPLDTWSTATYTGLWNHLDFPAVVLPVDEVRESDLADDVGNAKFGSEDTRLYSLYTGPKDYKGIPVCVQVVGYRHADEALLNIATMLDAILNGR